MRNVLPGRGGWQETILLNEPGTKPEDNIEIEACILLNMDGDRRSYTWEHGYPVFDLDGANIQYVNFKSEYKPFLIFREGGGFDVFNLEVRPEYSHFPWWNHWPVAQVISDGRSAFATDRTSHSSLSWGDPNGEAALYGMTNKDPESLVALARSWNYPAELFVSTEGWTNEGYEYRQRAYVLKAKDNVNTIEINMQSNQYSPLHNPCFVLKNWTPNALQLKVDGTEVPEGKDFRYGVEYDINGAPMMVVWIKHSSEKEVNFQLLSNE